MADKILKLYNNNADENKEEKNKLIEIISDLLESDYIDNDKKDKLKELSGMFSDEEFEYMFENDDEFKEELMSGLEEIKENLYNIDEDEYDEDDEEGMFGAFVVLSEKQFDIDNIIKTLKEDWGIEVDLNDALNEDREENEFYISDGETIIGINFDDSGLPKEIAMGSAQLNYMWKDAEKQIKKQKAMLSVIVVDSGEEDLKEISKSFVKAVSSCAKQKNVLSVLSNGVSYEPKYYISNSEIIKSNEIPLLNLVWVTVFVNEEDNTVTGFTNGMRIFGRKEIEVLNSDKEPDEIYEFLFNVSYCLLKEDRYFDEDIELKWSENEIFNITISEGVNIDDYTAKIDFCTKNK